MRRMRKELAALTAGLLLAAALTGCGAQPSQGAQGSYEAPARSERSGARQRTANKTEKANTADTADTADMAASDLAQAHGQSAMGSAERPSEEVLAYLEEVGLSGFEFGGGRPIAYKWTQPIKVEVSGDLADSDRQAITNVIADLNQLIAPLTIEQVESGGNITIWYGHDAEFPQRLPGYTPGNRGYFQVRYDLLGRLTHSDILISTEVGTKERSHLVREELTQSLGLFCDSWADADSIFYQGWTTTQQYTALDKEIIRALYDARVKPGMSQQQAENALRNS